MKAIYNFFLVIFSIIFVASCSVDSSNEDPNTLGGSTDVALAKVGNVFTPSITVAGRAVNFDGSLKVTNNDNGIVTVKAIVNTAKLSTDLKDIIDLFPAKYKDSAGNINSDIKFKVTSEGIQDFLNPDDKPHTIAKYNCSVGDKYVLTRSDGKTITREITAKSSTDEFPYGMLLLKTITTERNTSLPGVKKVIYKTNHKYGLVFVQLVMEDGSNGSMYIFSKN
ncbi:MAG: hypothetical protein HW421_1224 [Ignavibacteria bacterium]|nr:hypothetical protein [Ignavibacteria bacterium]